MPIKKTIQEGLGRFIKFSFQILLSGPRKDPNLIKVGFVTVLNPWLKVSIPLTKIKV